MIKFFRRLRQQLLSDNKFRKYLLYAIGEIILVVIGILIALSINNWNNEKKDRLKERAYIKSLLIDLEKDSTQLGIWLNDAIEISINIEDFLLFHNRDLSDPAKVDSLHLMFNKSIQLRTWPHTDRTLNQLESTGEFILLQADIADSLSVYKSMVERLKQQEGACVENIRNLREFADQYLHRHLVRYGHREYIDYDDDVGPVLTGKQLPPIQDSPHLKMELFNRAATYQGCMIFYALERANPLMDYLQMLIPHLKNHYKFE